MTVPDLLDDLAASQEQVAAWIRRHGDQEPTHLRVGTWSTRDVAAHLAACDLECMEQRIRSIARGEQPALEFYSNDGRDFSSVALEDALTEWAETRKRMLDFARSLTDAEITRVGIHATFGEITVADYLRILLDHDRGHLRDLMQEASEPAR